MAAIPTDTTTSPAAAMPMIAPVDKTSASSAAAAGVGVVPVLLPAAVVPVDDVPVELGFPAVAGTWHCEPVHAAGQAQLVIPRGVPPFRHVTSWQKTPEVGRMHRQREVFEESTMPPFWHTARLQSAPVYCVPVQSHCTWRLNKKGVPCLQTLHCEAC